VIAESCVPLSVLFTAYANSDLIGSFSKMHELLSVATQENPVAGNAHGSYLTMRSKNGLIFGVINVVGYVGLLVCLHCVALIRRHRHIATSPPYSTIRHTTNEPSLRNPLLPSKLSSSAVSRGSVFPSLLRLRLDYRQWLLVTERTPWCI
jgi:hypothetical protein